MATTKYNENNFFENTAAVFSICDKPNREPDYISASGSSYWYENNGVVRCADHWGWGIASCCWYLRELEMSWSSFANFLTLYSKFGDERVCAFCAFDDFKNAIELAASVPGDVLDLYITSVNNLF